MGCDSVAEREFDSSRRVTDSQVWALVTQGVFAVTENRSLHFPCW